MEQIEVQTFQIMFMINYASVHCKFVMHKDTFLHDVTKLGRKCV